ncbi:MAG: 1-deoxy-D-xylulose-5-phosphate reductoisomerase [Actinobacteria bacterium]|uniref:1-deoxy-D-xylulose-5-phosphate reductoisomerase n=1 Tax=freshwater metagenome TaxID=449393 RepID=A0A6J6T077_9ZZZZ|nr:1-deoxy-D-xylulose-5-phosphate reductoisomerase [Actinomycetota bacterium]
MNSTSVRSVIVLGSTGSIGTQTLDIIRQNSAKFKVVGISAGGNNPGLLAQQAIEFQVEYLALANATAAQDVQLALYAQAKQAGYSEGNFTLPKLLVGPQAATELAGIPVDVVMNGITGAVGLMPTVAALKSGGTLALANKESLVIGGTAVTKLASPGQIVPVDSEHSAIAQCLRSGTTSEVRRIVLTASGGPFRGRSMTELAEVTPQQALAHPTWTMGPVVTINSATMMNKGLEVIEAHLLFALDFDQIDVVVHPQSVVHSMVEFVDGSTIAQASPPDMHLPIALGLTWPNRIPDASTACNWQEATSWTFEPLDQETFPAVALAKRAGKLAGTAPAVLNGANEVAVAAFLAGTLGFTEIVEFVAQVLEVHLETNFVSDQSLTIEEVLQAAEWAQLYGQELLESRN